MTPEIINSGAVLKLRTGPEMEPKNRDQFWGEGPGTEPSADSAKCSAVYRQASQPASQGVIDSHFIPFQATDPNENNSQLFLLGWQPSMLHYCLINVQLELPHVFLRIIVQKSLVVPPIPNRDKQKIYLCSF